VSKIQILASAITQSLTLEEIFKLDLGFSPHFNMPIDFVQTACLVLKNKIDRVMKTITLEEFDAEKQTLDGIIDVSPFSEHTQHSIPGSINIPLENLRREEVPFPKEANVVLYSHTSSGAYKAYRYLISKGYTHLRVLEGGFLYWEH
jgi:rhodanese-related sulfurtransferase